MKSARQYEQFHFHLFQSFLTRQTLSKQSWMPFLSMQLLTAFLLYRYLPETSGKDVDEIVSQWMSARDVRKDSAGSTPDQDTDDDEHYDYRRGVDDRRPLLLDYEALQATNEAAYFF